jgi:hypothetical protein
LNDSTGSSSVAIIVKDNQENSPQIGNTNLPLAMNSQQAKVFDLLRGFSTEGVTFHEW